MRTDIRQHMSASDILMLLVLSVLWGGSFFFVEILVDHLPPLTIVTARVVLAAIGLWSLVFGLGLEIPKTARVWRALLVVGLVNNAIPFVLIVWGQTQIPSGLASIYNALTPVFTVIVAGVLLVDERFTTKKIVGVILGLIGSAILIGPSVIGSGDGSVLGQLAVMGAALSYAFAAVFSRRFKTWGLSPIIVATGQVTMAGVMLLPLALWFEQPWTISEVPFAALASMIGLALFCTVGAYILYFRLIASAGATNAALVTFLIPISAILLGVTFLNESLSAVQILGMGVIGFGLIVLDGRVFTRLRGG